ncbi:hypothetical protein FACS1894158_11430 [Betaproteobacteria bacterium]|nr:hypothetical protein FACS1894158_11430 [Betaproteobacteria bacterium]
MNLTVSPVFSLTLSALVGPEVLGVEVELALFVELEDIAAAEMTAEVAGFCIVGGVLSEMAAKVGVDFPGPGGGFDIGLTRGGRIEDELCQYAAAGVLGVALAVNPGGGKTVVAVVTAFAVFDEDAGGQITGLACLASGEADEEIVAVDIDVRAGVVPQFAAADSGEAEGVVSCHGLCLL